MHKLPPHRPARKTTLEAHPGCCNHSSPPTHEFWSDIPGFLGKMRGFRDLVPVFDARNSVKILTRSHKYDHDDGLH